MAAFPPELLQRLREHGQEAIVACWERLNEAQRATLLEDLQAINLDQLRDLYRQREKSYALPSSQRIQPAPVIRLDADHREARRLGSQALERGEVAALVVAGGQGTRLGFDHPKGMFSVGPVSKKSLLQIHAEKVLALRRRHGKPIPFLVMTSLATEAET
jgi:UDP-N-acetylglucosamine/UDP-N-acetylgalactosamine diphosphorylase